jgi:hypothetical protein
MRLPGKTAHSDHFKLPSVVAMVVAGTRPVVQVVLVVAAVCTTQPVVQEPLGKVMLVAHPLKATVSPVVVVAVPVVQVVPEPHPRKMVVLPEPESTTQLPAPQLPMPAVERVLAEAEMETALARRPYV